MYITETVKDKFGTTFHGVNLSHNNHFVLFRLKIKFEETDCLNCSQYPYMVIFLWFMNKLVFY